MGAMTETPTYMTNDDLYALTRDTIKSSRRPYSEIAKKLGVSSPSISRVLRGIDPAQPHRDNGLRLRTLALLGIPVIEERYVSAEGTINHRWRIE